MMTSHSLILHVIILLHTLDPAISQLKVQASVGDAVLLPCLYSKMDSLTEDVSVFWRDQNNRIVLDIREKVPVWKTQNPGFKGRVFWEAELYGKGNFSILMTDIRQADSGSYECVIPAIDFQQDVMLSVSVNRGGVEGGSGASGGVAVVTTTSFFTALLLLSRLIF